MAEVPTTCQKCRSPLWRVARRRKIGGGRKYAGKPMAQRIKCECGADRLVLPGRDLGCQVCGRLTPVPDIPVPPKPRTLLDALQERNPAITEVRMNPDGESVTITENLNGNPNVVLIPPALLMLESAPMYKIWDFNQKVAVKRSWADEWANMSEMSLNDRRDRFKELAAGRDLPQGFRDWPKERRIEWLDHNWSLA